MSFNKILGTNGKEIALHVELHPGEVLADELQARKLTKAAFAEQIGINANHFNDIVKCKRNITANIALRIEKALNIPAEFWLGLQMEYDLFQERNKAQEAA